MSRSTSDRPYSTPPTNVELSNNYQGLDRGLFITRDPEPQYLRVVNAQWMTWGPSGSPGLLRARIGRFETRPILPEDYENFEFLTTATGDEWFEVVTTGPIHKAILVEYWIKFIYYNYYVLNSQPVPVSADERALLTMVQTGTEFTRSLAPSINVIENQVVYTVQPDLPLTLTSFISKVTPEIGEERLEDLTERALVAGDRFDPVIELTRYV